MGKFIVTVALVALWSCGLTTERAAAADAEVRYVITNGGVDVEDHGQFHLHPAGHHDDSDIAWSGSGGSVSVPSGAYDVRVTFSDGAAHKEFWIDNQKFAGKVEKSVEIDLPLTDVRYVVANGGVDVEDHGQFHLHPAGHHDDSEVAWSGSGGVVRVPVGAYDVLVIFSDGAAHKEIWFDNQKLSGKVEKSVEMNLPVAEVRYRLTNGGVDVEDHGQYHVFPVGHPDGSEVTWAGSGNSVRLAAGAYDVHLIFEDGPLHRDQWLNNQKISGKVDQTIEMGAREAVAVVRYVVKNGGVDVRDQGQFHLYPAGHHDGPEIAWSGSGNSVRVLADAYDVLITFNDGAAHKDIWIDNQRFAGKVDKSVEIDLPIAEARYVVTNGGLDTQDHGQFHLHSAGRHEDSEVAWSGSGGSVRIPAGAYDVLIRFSDGAAHKDVWIDNQTLEGKVGKSVEIGMPVGEARYVVVNGGADVGEKGQFHVFPAGHHDGDEVVWSGSGNSVRLPAGAYDVAITFSDGLIHKKKWLDGEQLSGKVDKTVELALRLAEPTVTVTRNGADVGDKADVGFIDPASHDEAGSVRSGETATLEAGTYDIRATLFDAEGWLRAAPLSGKQSLAIELKPLKTEKLKVGGPLPTACAIEVYGVNFDFDKSVLRPDSEAILKQVLALFTHAPEFKAEVGGHTDNVGKPDYNVKLSADRAAAVRSWLIAHAVAPERVTSHGYGDTRPLVPNTTDENRFKNRRVELRTAKCR